MDDNEDVREEERVWWGCRGPVPPRMEGEGGEGEPEPHRRLSGREGDGDVE